MIEHTTVLRIKYLTDGQRSFCGEFLPLQENFLLSLDFFVVVVVINCSLKSWVENLTGLVVPIPVAGVIPLQI